MAEFTMPMLGADMEAGTLVEWLKQPGDSVSRGDIVAVVDTEKGAIEIEVFEDGVIEKILVEPGEKVPVGTPLAVIGGGAAPPAAAPERAQKPPAPGKQAAPKRAAVPSAPAEAPEAAAASRPPAPAPPRRRVSPAARKAAEALDVDVEGVEGTGPGGSVVVADVERAAAPTAAPRKEPAPAAPDRVAAMRRAIGAAMARSKREIPHFYLSTTVDLHRATEWLAEQNATRPITERVLPVVLMLKAVARALVDVPGLNGFWQNGTFEPGSGIHLGCAISLKGGGLVAPALHDVDRKTLSALMTELSDLVGRARSGSLRSSELSDPTLTVTNLGDMGVEATFGIIFPPQVALVGFGKVVRRPWAVNDAVGIRPVVTVTLSTDHRAVDGHLGARFLAAVDRHLQHPEAL